MYFNPRSYKRSDIVSQIKGVSNTFISIHAPTRGATLGRGKLTMTVIDFNPRSYKRSDAYCHYSDFCVKDFNPRSYKRSDQRHPSIIFS